jgi:hypothetical protein
MLRLLYLLIRQRMWRRPRPTPPVVPVGSVRRPPFKALHLGIATVAVCRVVGGVVAFSHSSLDPATPLETMTETATLQLQIHSIDSAPLVVFLEPPGASTRDTDKASRETVRITSVNNAFEPRFQVASLAAQIEVANDDPIPHNTHLSDGHYTLFNVAVPLAGVRVRKLLARPGILHVRCDIHPWMHAWIFVPANPHHAVIWEPGQVTLRDIAPGRYRMHVWEPKRSEVTLMLTLESGETKSLSFAGR